MNQEVFLLVLILSGIIGYVAKNWWSTLSTTDALLFAVTFVGSALMGLVFIWNRFSKLGKERAKRLTYIREIPECILKNDSSAIALGFDTNLKIPIFLPDSIRSRHVHILGSTGSGKTESVVLNFLKQDVARGFGAIVLDAKGDASFEESLRKWVPQSQLQIFDLGNIESLSYNPLSAGSPLEAAQRLFTSLVWSEEYYKSKAFSAVQKIFEAHHKNHSSNPTLLDVSDYLEDPGSFAGITLSDTYPLKLAEKDFSDLSGLRDQLKSLTTGHLRNILSPKNATVTLDDFSKGRVTYFRLQSLMSPQIVSSVGKLVINHLNFIAGTAHRKGRITERQFLPVYLDEFASFACAEFADLISKARSAGFGLHFSHQSIGDLVEVSEGFLNRITDNSCTKIVLRINDPDSAEYLSRTFGTRLYHKKTQRITNAQDVEDVEILTEGTQREAHQFRASPDLLKTLPTGVGSVLIAHGFDTPHGASTVFKIKFPFTKEV